LKRIIAHALLFSAFLRVTAPAGVHDATGQRVNTPDDSRYTASRRIDAAGVVRAWYNVNAPSTQGAPEDVARAFLRAHRDALGMVDVDASVRTEQIQSAPGGWHVRFLQQYRGVPVFRGDIVVSANSENRVGMVVNNMRADVSVASTTPALNAQAALQLAARHLNLKGRTIGKEDEAELMIYASGTGNCRLAYRVTMTNEDPLGDWEVFVDAQSGEILHTEDLFVMNRTQGGGYAYLSDPLSAARAFYNSTGFADNSDADSDSLRAYRSYVVLDSITYEDGVFKLKGPYCNVTDVESPAGPVCFSASSPLGFTFTRNQQEFEAVNVYYHVTAAYRHIERLGFDSPSLRQVRLDPHGFNGQDNSHYSPTGNWIAWGEGGVDDAEDADVIWHEYGHAIMYNIIPTWGGGESGALGEGFGDYWAGSYSRSLAQWQPADMQYPWMFNWDGHNPFWLGRVLNDTRTYPFGTLPIHTAGQIWSAALMGIWGDLGRDITDRLVLKSFHYLGSWVTAPVAAQAIIQADRDLYGGAHLQTLAYWLGSVKRFINPEEYLPLITHQPPPATLDLEGPFEVRATVSSARGIDEQQVRLIWGRDGIFSDTTVMTHTQNTNEFVGLIPGNGQSCFVRYYIRAADSLGAVATCPMNAPAVYDSFQVGNPGISGIEAYGDGHPDKFMLSQNYPNPFNPATTIRMSLASSQLTTLKVYDLLGREVATLINEEMNPGTYSVQWDATGVASGVYLYRLEAGAYSETKRLILLR
jgi:hypothetical protein